MIVCVNLYALHFLVIAINDILCLYGTVNSVSQSQRAPGFCLTYGKDRLVEVYKAFLVLRNWADLRKETTYGEFTVYDTPWLMW